MASLKMASLEFIVCKGLFLDQLYDFFVSILQDSFIPIYLINTSEKGTLELRLLYFRKSIFMNQHTLAIRLVLFRIITCKNKFGLTRPDRQRWQYLTPTTWNLTVNLRVFIPLITLLVRRRYLTRQISKFGVMRRVRKNRITLLTNELQDSIFAPDGMTVIKEKS